MRDRPMAFIKELGFYPLNSRDDFNVIKDFFKQENFDDKYLNEELELTKIILPDLKAEEIIELYIKMKQDYDLRRAVMFLKLLRYSYSSGGKSFACQPFSLVSLERCDDDCENFDDECNCCDCICDECRAELAESEDD